MSFDAFYEAFHSCNETAQAIAAGKVSTEPRNLKSFTLPPKQPETKFELPYPFPNLLHLQSFDGKWTNLELVLKCLHLPPNTNIPNAEDWQQATALAVAFIRQRYDLFEHLGDAHDKAAQWITSSFINAARDILNEFDPDFISKPLSLFTLTTMPSTLTISPQNTIEMPHSEDAFDDATIDTVETGHTNMSSALLSALGPSFDLSTLSERIEAVSHQILIYQSEVIRHAVSLDERYNILSQCYKRCAQLYHSAVTHKERNAAFDEFTALLGADRPARPGFEGWRGRRLLGYRSCAMDILRNIHNMATQKLLLQELIRLQHRSGNESVTSVSTTLALDVEDNWTVIWNNEDLALHVLSSLNSFASLSLLRQWYGESYPYASNPLALPLSLEDIAERILPYNKVSQFLAYCTTVAKHLARASIHEVSDDSNLRRQERIYRNEIIAFQETMQSELRDFPSWWPACPDVIDMQQSEYLYLSLLVFRIKTASSHEKQAAAEAAEAAARPVSKVGTQLPPKKGSLLAGILGLPSANTSAPPPATMPLPSRQAPESFKQWLFTYDYLPKQEQSPQRKSSVRKKSRKNSSRKASTESSHKPSSAPVYAEQADGLGAAVEDVPLREIPIRRFDEEEDDILIPMSPKRSEATIAAPPVAENGPSTPPTSVSASQKSQPSQISRGDFALDARRPSATSAVSHTSLVSNVSKLTEKSNITNATKTSKQSDDKPILANIEFKQAPVSPKPTSTKLVTKPDRPKAKQLQMRSPIGKKKPPANPSPPKAPLSTKFPKKKKPSQFLSSTGEATSLPAIHAKPRVARANFPVDKKMTRRAKTAPKLKLEKEVDK